jgi:hypothetical protein
MTGQFRVAVLIGLIALAGCTGGPWATETTDHPDDGELPPGVTDGQVTNASALLEANEAALREAGFAANVSHAADSDEPARYEIVATAGFTQYALDGDQPGSSGSVEMHLWTNESHRVSMYESGGETRYQATERGTEPFSGLEMIEHAIRAGNFTVANETTANGYTVLTAEEFAPNTNGAQRFPDAEAFDARGVVDDAGRIHEFTVTIDRAASNAEAYTFELRETGVDSIDRPAWLEEVPPGAFISPQVSIDVQNESVLTVENTGTDAVPANATLELSMNDTTYRAVFDQPLESGDKRYAALAATDDTLQFHTEGPTDSEVQSLSSPISVTIATENGVTLHSSGMGWDSASASEPGSSGSSSEVSGHGGSRASE